MKTLAHILVAAVLAVPATLAFGCSPTSNIDEEDAADLLDEEPEADTLASQSDCFSRPACQTNCVEYVRCRKGSLPSGLKTLNDKKLSCNVPKGYPAAGYAAVTLGDPTYGHLAYVESVSGSQITISECNWAGKCGTRTGTVSQLQIQCYIK